MCAGPLVFLWIFPVRKAMAQAVAFRFLFAESGYLLCIAAFCYFIAQGRPALSPYAVRKDGMI